MLAGDGCTGVAIAIPVRTSTARMPAGFPQVSGGPLAGLLANDKNGRHRILGTVRDIANAHTPPTAKWVYCIKQFRPD